LAAKGDITANVGINVAGGGLDTVIGGLESHVIKLLGQLDKIGDNAAKQTKKSKDAAEKAVADIGGQIKSLQAMMGQINTLSKLTANSLNANKVVGTDASDRRLANQIKGAAAYRRSLEDSIGVAEKLKARIAEIDRETANMGKNGQRISDSRLREQEKLNVALKEYEKFQKDLSNLQVKAQFLSPGSQKQLDELFMQAQQMKAVFNDITGDKRFKNFGTFLEAQKNITAEIGNQIKLLGQEERAEERLAAAGRLRATNLAAKEVANEQALLDKTRQRAQELVNISTRQRQINLEQGAASLKNRLTPTQMSFGAAVGEEGMVNRLNRVTLAYAAAKRQLGEASAKDSTASTEQISKLIGQYERLEAKLRETLALKEKMASQSMAGSAAPAAAGQSKLGASVSGLLGDGGLALGARVGIYGLAAGGVYSVINAIKEGAKFVVDFDDKLATLAAISGSTGTQMKGLADNIIDVSKNSKFSAIDIADAATQLAQAGFSAGDMKEALGDVVKFAAASGTSVTDSVNLITGALGAFQLQASETGRVTDIITAALNRSKLTSQQVAQAIQYVGTTAYEQNINLEQLVATIGSVAQAGVKAGSTLGTGFRQFLVDLANPTENLKGELTKLNLSLGQVDVKTRGLPAVLDTLKNAGFGAAQAYQGLEVRAAAFYLAAKNNIDVSNQLMLAESAQGTAMIANARAMDSLSAQWQRFKNILGEIALDSAPVDFLKGLIRVISDTIEKHRELVKELKEHNADATQKVLNNTASGFDDYASADWIEMSKHGSILIQILNDMSEDARQLGIQVGDLGTEMDQSGRSMADYATASANAADETAKQSNKLSELQNEYQRLLTQGPSIREDTVQTAIQTNSLTSRFEGLAGMLGNTANGYDNLVAAMQRYNVQQLGNVANAAATQKEAARNEFNANNTKAKTTYGSILNSPGFKQLGSADQAAFNQAVTEHTKPGGLAKISDLIDKFSKVNSPQVQSTVKAMSDLVQTFHATSASKGVYQSSGALLTDARKQANPVYQREFRELSRTKALIEDNRADAQAQSPEERAKTFAPMLSSLDTTIKHLDNLLVTNKGDKGASRVLNRLRDDAVATRTSTRGIINPSAKETKAEERERKASERTVAQATRTAERAQNKYNRNEVSASQATLRSADKQLSTYLKGDSVGLKLSKIPELLESGDKALADWTEARKDVLSDTIAKDKPDPRQIKELTEAMNDEIEAKNRETYQKQMEVIDKSITDYLARQTKNIEREFTENNRPFVQGVARQQALSTGLDNPLNNGAIPNYTKTIQTRRVQEAQDKLDRNNAGMRIDGKWTGGENEKRIKQYEADYDRLTEAVSDYSARREEAFNNGNTEKVKAFDAEIESLNEKLGTARQKADDLTDANEALRTSFEAQDLAPKTFGEGVSQAIEAFAIEHNTSLSTTQRLMGGLGDVLESSHQAFQNFFTSIVTGTSSVGAAFGGMAKAVISAIMEMAAKAVATQIFGLLLSFIPAGSGAHANFIKSNTAAGIKTAWHGGAIDNLVPQRLAGGGGVRSGLPTRDSTLVHAAKGEYMLRKSAVDSIGQKNLDDMNHRGSAALDKFKNNNIVMPQSQLNSSVYVVLPEERPSLGPNDVLAIVSRDVLRGGATKALIKQVSAGN
jgi:TP901 family phage tail tape measure protein